MAHSYIIRIICKSFVLIWGLISLSPLAALTLIPTPPNVETVSVAPPVPNVYIFPETIKQFEQAQIHNKPVYDLLTLNERAERGLPATLPNIQPYYGEKVVYLTFDDGPDLVNTPAILDILDREEVKATFFVVGTQVERNPELLTRIFKAGHAIGNHSYNHTYKELYISPGAYISQLKRTEEIIKSIIQVRPLITRAPGGPAGSFTKEYWRQLQENGYLDVCWNISSGDASGLTAQGIIANIKKQQAENKFLWSHSIVLMHDGSGHGETVKALPLIIELYKKQGFTFQVVNIETPPAW